MTTWLEQRIPREITQRFVIECDLVLQTGTHFGSGSANEQTDTVLLLDEVEGKPLLLGTTLAGALRNYLYWLEVGDMVLEENYKPEHYPQKTVAEHLFGGLRGKNEDYQSSVIIDDAYGEATRVELRDGVGINHESRTAQEDRLYNIDLWSPGTTFPLRFELILHQEDNLPQLLGGLLCALNGLSNGEIRLGARKHRGFGKVGVNQWFIHQYDLAQVEDLRAWINHGAKRPVEAMSLEEMFTRWNLIEVQDRRTFFYINLALTIDGSLLIRSDGGLVEMDLPGMVHLHTRRIGEKEAHPIVSGTAITGALRARSRQILSLFDKSDQLDKLFGNMIENSDATPTASRIHVNESAINLNEVNLIQNRVSIDRFTGGAKDTALFDQMPIFSSKHVETNIELIIYAPKEWEIGLALMLMKDLWTGDLPIGGEQSVGRGRLSGIHAYVCHKNGQFHEWQFEEDRSGRLNAVGNSAPLEMLQMYVDRLVNNV